MALTLTEIKDLITFGRDIGLSVLRVQDLEAMYGAPPIQVPVESTQPADQNVSGIPEEFRHYSAKGRAAFGKTP